MKKHEKFLFKKNNYKILIISLLTLALGFLLMIGGGASNPDDFNPAIFSMQRIVIAPIIIIIGYIGMIVSIFYND
tara:strand:+ start:425 stop:649 length:225 start_codon:yes stop_codon:yes gene_type:complete